MGGAWQGVSEVEGACDDEHRHRRFTAKAQRTPRGNRTREAGAEETVRARVMVQDLRKTAWVLMHGGG
jgi:hypothetical protein